MKNQVYLYNPTMMRMINKIKIIFMQIIKKINKKTFIYK